MALPDFSLRQLLEAGVHFGHQTHRWNPKMQPYIYGDRNGIHIIDLTQTVPLLNAALNAMRDMVAKGGRILFVGTKRQAARPLADAARRSAQYYMNHRWLGGTLTNWKTISNSIDRLKALDEQLESGSAGYTKKELLNRERERTKLSMSLEGIREMGGVPDMLFVIDTNREALAVTEAKKLGIPVVAILDTNSDPDGVIFPIPGNDDAARAIALYCDLAARAVIDGMASQLGAAGFDLGELEDLPKEEGLPESAAGKAAEEDRTSSESEVSGESVEAVKKSAAEAGAKEPDPAAEAMSDPDDIHLVECTGKVTPKFIITTDPLWITDTLDGSTPKNQRIPRADIADLEEDSDSGRVSFKIAAKKIAGRQIPADRFPIHERAKKG